MNLIKFDEMKKNWFQIARNNSGESTPEFELEVHKKLLNIFHVGDFYYYICNIARVEMELVSDSIIYILGLKSPSEFTVEYIFNHIHPEDLNRFISFEHAVTRFFTQLPPDKVLKYKPSYDYRLQCTDGSYKWILQQTVTIQSDDEGAVIRVLGVQTDISHLKSDNKPSGLSFIGLEGEPSYYNVPVNEIQSLPSKEIFSTREKQVLRLIIEGKSSSKIANMLAISQHTVNSHRKNILRKSGCSNWIELSSKAVIQGWV